MRPFESERAMFRKAQEEYLNFMLITMVFLSYSDLVRIVSLICSGR